MAGFKKEPAKRGKAWKKPWMRLAPHAAATNKTKTKIRRLWIAWNDSNSDGVARQIRGSMDSELFPNVLAVLLNGIDADAF